VLFAGWSSLDSSTDTLTTPDSRGNSLGRWDSRSLSYSKDSSDSRGSREGERADNCDGMKIGS